MDEKGGFEFGMPSTFWPSAGYTGMEYLSIEECHLLICHVYI